jgi:hypothetical protein
MYASFRALLTGLIDYAGLFPPAQLPLEEAVRNYARYSTEPESWMLGRFICPAGRLAELTPLVPELFNAESPLLLSILLGKGNTPNQFLASLPEDAKAAAEFKAKNAPLVRLQVLEMRLPGSFEGEEPEKLAEMLTSSRVLVSGLPGTVMPFHEITLGPGWRHTVSVFLLGLRTSIRPLEIRSPEGEVLGVIDPSSAGFKLRCGGIDAAAFPSPEQVAHVVAECRDRGIPFKATAGLHHPLRHYDRALQTHIHGFVNVFGAAVLADSCRLAEGQIRQVIEDEDPRHFVFDDHGFRWQDFRATTAEITSARKKLATSFGSCSFNEPREDLKALGWL